MTLKYYFLQLICFLWLIQTIAATSVSLAKPGCKQTCGNVTIPYPFGMGVGCFLNQWYEVSCLDDVPYISQLYGEKFRGTGLEVLKVGVHPFPEIFVKPNDTNVVCSNSTMVNLLNLTGSPFYYGTNAFTFIGCGNIILSDQKTFSAGCTSICDQGRNTSDCQILLPSLVQHISVNYTYLGTSESNTCGQIVFGTYDSARDFPIEKGVYLRWMVPYSPISGVIDQNNCHNNSDTLYGTNNATWRCYCHLCYYGNPYIENGCQFDSSLPYCGHSKKRLVMISISGTSFGILFLAIVTLFLFKKIRKRRIAVRKKKFFIRNGGLLLQQQQSIDDNMVDKVRFFTSSELERATDNFNENRILGQGGQGTVYKGMLVDGKIVALKKSKLVDENQVEQFINEVVVLSEINHRNVVKLLGCCLETNVPMLVYEFIPNGTLYDLIHKENDDILLSWDMRLRIATEASGALTYLHSATSIPIYHRDIKSSNILLDEKYRAKVSDFGISRHVTTDQTHLTTMVKGTFGYLDPEYFQSNQFTEKSDVYSFGVVLVELLTRQKPISSARNAEESGLSLATRFLTCMEEDKLDIILDGQISEANSIEQVRAVAMLAQQCLSLNGKRRPSMKEVAQKLESIKMSHLPLVFQQISEENEGSEIQPTSFPDVFFSSITTNDAITSSSDVNPLLSDTFRH